MTDELTAEDRAGLYEAHLELRARTEGTWTPGWQCGDDEPHGPHAKLGDGRPCDGYPDKPPKPFQFTGYDQQRILNLIDECLDRYDDRQGFHSHLRSSAASSRPSTTRCGGVSDDRPD